MPSFRHIADCYVAFYVQHFIILRGVFYEPDVYERTKDTAIDFVYVLAYGYLHGS